MQNAPSYDFLGGGGELGPSTAKAPPLTAEQVARAAVARETRAAQEREAQKYEAAARNGDYRELRAAADRASVALNNWIAKNTVAGQAGVDWGLLPAAAKITGILIATAATGGLAAPSMATLYSDAKKVISSLDSPEEALATVESARTAVASTRAQLSGEVSAVINTLNRGGSSASTSATPTVTVRSSAAAPVAAAPPAPPAALPPVSLNIPTAESADSIWALYAKGSGEAVRMVDAIRAAAKTGNTTAKASLVLLTAAESRAAEKARAKAALSIPTAESADSIWALYAKGSAEAVFVVDAIRAAAKTGNTTAKASLKLLVAAEERAAAKAQAAADLAAAIAAVATPAGADAVWDLHSRGQTTQVEAIRASAATGNTKAKAALKNLQAAEARRNAAAAPPAAPATPAAADAPAAERGFVVTAAGRVLEGTDWFPDQTGAGVLGTLVRTSGPPALRMDETERRWVRA